MRHDSNTGFVLGLAEIKNDIFIPRYYDPRIGDELDALAPTHHCVSLDELADASQLRHDHGSYVPKINYGAGPVPYIRTSDLSNWEIKASPKHGVPVEVYHKYREKQDVRAEDILFVHEGTYLIGSAAMVTPFEGPLLYQHHLAKFRVLPSAPFGPYFLLIALESPTVQRQVRAKQFTADIIDSVVGRLGQVVIPYPKDVRRVKAIETKAKCAVLERVRIRERMTHAVRQLDVYLQRAGAATLETIFGWTPPEKPAPPDFLGYKTGFTSFNVGAGDVVNDILIPKYYDPAIEDIGKRYTTRCELTTVGQLEEEGLISLETGVEVGKMAYGTGDIPFVRTSDLGSWELKREAKQGISPAVYAEWQQDVQADDILLIRDGTYLVGSSILVNKADLPLLYCGGIYKIRSLNPRRLQPALLYAMLNLPFVRRQMRNKQFTRDVIDTLGRRLREVHLPVPKDAEVRSAIGSRFGRLASQRNALQVELSALMNGLYPQPTDASSLLTAAR